VLKLSSEQLVLFFLGCCCLCLVATQPYICIQFIEPSHHFMPELLHHLGEVDLTNQFAPPCVSLKSWCVIPLYRFIGSHPNSSIAWVGLISSCLGSSSRKFLRLAFPRHLHGECAHWSWSMVMCASRHHAHPLWSPSVDPLSR
jgi:hypothetical protein